MARDVCLTILSDDEFSKVELEQKAKILHEDITKHRIARELELLQKLIDRANEKGWRNQLFQYLEKRKLLQQPSYLSFVLQNIPGVIPEEVELESLDKNGNQMQLCANETTPTKQNIPGVIPEEVELEPLVVAKDEKDDNKMHQCADETTPAEVVKCEPEDGATCSGS